MSIAQLPQLPMAASLLKKSTVIAALCLFAIPGCRGIDDGLDDDTGEIGLWITDAPVQGVDRLIITITGVVITPREGDPIHITLDRPLEVDLIDVIREPEMREKIVDDVRLPPGLYDSIRLVLDETRLFIDIAGSLFQPTIPEAGRAGLQVPFNVDVDDDTALDLTIDFDVRKSLRDLSDDTLEEKTFELHPDLRIVRTETTGTLVGTVAENLIRDPDCENGIDHDEGNAVYVYSGSGVNFQDLQDNAGDPLVTARVDLDFSTGEFTFIAGFLPRGNYTAIFTCDGAIDDPEVDNSVDMLFSESIDVEIDAGETTSIVF